MILYAVHLSVVLGIGKMCGIPLPDLLMASNANIGNTVGHALPFTPFFQAPYPPFLTPYYPIFTPLCNLARNASFDDSLLIGNAATASSLATSKGWKSRLLPGILVGTLGNAIGTFCGLFLGVQVLKPLSGF